MPQTVDPEQAEEIADIPQGIEPVSEEDRRLGALEGFRRDEDRLGIGDLEEPSDQTLTDKIQGAKDTADILKDLKEKSQKPKTPEEIEKPPIQEPLEPAPIPPPVEAPVVESVAGAGEAAEAAEVAGKDMGLKGVEKKAFEAGKKKIAARSAGQVVKQEAIHTAEKQAATAAAEQVGARAAATAASEAALGALTAGTAWLVQGALLLVTSKKVRTWAMWGIIVIVLLPIILVFMLKALSVGGPTKTPATAAEKVAADTLAAKTGDPAALRKTVGEQTDTAISSLQGYRTKVTSVYSGDAAKQAAATAAIDHAIGSLTTLKNLTDPTVRTKAIDALVLEITALYQNYPTLFGFGAECKDLKPYIDGGQLTWLKPNDPDQDLIVQGFLVNSDRQTLKANPHLCSALVYFFKNGFTVASLTTANAHVTHGQASQHYSGDAVDIAVINGKSVNTPEGKIEAQKLMALVHGNLSLFAVNQMIGPDKSLSYDRGGKTFSDATLTAHQNHVHLGFIR